MPSMVYYIIEGLQLKANKISCRESVIGSLLPLRDRCPVRGECGRELLPEDFGLA
jgi:hypothetical protein